MSSGNSAQAPSPLHNDGAPILIKIRLIVAEMPANDRLTDHCIINETGNASWHA
jgi:hypothetical protein